MNVLALSREATVAAKPPLKQAPKQVVVLLGNKLVGLDSILPVTMELKAENPGLRISFVFLNGSALPVVERNYALHRAMLATGEVSVLASGKGPLRKLVAGARLGWLAAAMLLRRTLLLSPGDLGRFPLNILARAARAGGGSACVYCKPSFPGNPALNYAQGLKTVGRDMRWRDPGDAFLIYHPRHAGDYSDYGMAAPILLGTPRDYPAWRRFLASLAAETGIRDEEGRDLGQLPRPLFAVFYPGNAVIPHQLDNVRESFLGLLQVIAAQAPGASVVIKPHPICDLEVLRRDIAGFPEIDIRISHAHPQLVLGLATAAIATHGSNVIFDSYLENIPVIETTRYRADILAIGESIYPNRGRVDGSSPARLIAAIRAAAGAPETLPKPDPAELVWPKPPAISPSLWAR